jgi:N-acetylmuramoyl-L-alanine amidase
MSVWKRIKAKVTGAPKPEPDKSAMGKPLKPADVSALPNIIKAKRPVTELIWHCAATPEGKDFTVKDIDAWHKARGWSKIGYHFVIYRDGTIKAGRPVDEVGAHVQNRNAGTIGACYIGGVDARGRNPKDTRTAAQRAAMLWLTKQLAATYGLKIISGHNQYNKGKACPSFDVRRDELGNIPGYVRGIKAKEQSK